MNPCFKRKTNKECTSNDEYNEKSQTANIQRPCKQKRKRYLKVIDITNTLSKIKNIKKCLVGEQ